MMSPTDFQAFWAAAQPMSRLRVTSLPMARTASTKKLVPVQAGRPAPSYRALGTYFLTVSTISRAPGFDEVHRWDTKAAT